MLIESATVDDVHDEELDWMRGTPIGMTLASALPTGFAVTGVLDTGGDDPLQDHALLEAVAPDPNEVLVAGVLIRSRAEEHEPGSEHRLYTDWGYRFRRRTVRDLYGRLDGEGLSRWQTAWILPEILFPEDHRFLVTTLWDDSWRSIGADEATAARIEAALPTFERLDRDADLRATGRQPF